MRAGFILPLASLCLLADAGWVSRPGLYPSSVLEELVFGVLLLRVVVFFFHPKVRKAPISTAVVLFGSDIFVVTLAAAAFAITGSQDFTTFNRQFVSAWLGAAALLCPLVATYLTARALGARPRLYNLLPSAGACFALFTFITASMNAGSGAGGLSGIAAQMAGVFHGTSVSAVPTPVLSVLGAALFASMIAYATLGTRGEMPNWMGPLALAATGTMALFVWTVAVLSLGPVWLTMGVPAGALVVVVWVATRE
jgi:hypothetical protein